VNQNAGRAGNPNPVYYGMAAVHGVCNSSDGNAADSSCIFYNVTEGDIAVNCSGTVGCFVHPFRLDGGLRRQQT